MYAILKALALPPGSSILLFTVGLVAILLGQRKTGAIIIAAGIGLLYLASVPFASSYLGRFVQQVPPTPIYEIATSDAQAIVVLSAGYTRAGQEYGYRTVDALTLQRLRYAARVYRQHPLPILVSGGRTVFRPTPPLGELMRAVLEDEFKVPVQWVENQSQDTSENAALSSEILKSAGINSIVLVTHAMHMPRAMAIFREHGMTVIPAATDFAAGYGVEAEDFIPRMSALEESYYAIYEILGSVWYDLSSTK